MCIRVDPARSTAVSGQVGSKPTIFTWDACTGEKKNRIKIAKGARGITAVAINEAGWICAVDLHNEHQVYVYDDNMNCVFKQKGDTNKIHDVCWDSKPGSKRFSTAGVKHMYFWEAEANSEKKKGLFMGAEQTSFACTAWDDNGMCYSGGSNGSIYAWGGDGGRTCEKTLPTHKGFICALKHFSGKLYSGAKDGKVIVTDLSSMSKTNEIQFPSLIRAIDTDGTNLVVGQRDGTISLCDAAGTKTDVMKSHSDGEVWGLAR